MKFMKATALGAILLVATAAYAGPAGHKTDIKIIVDDGDGEIRLALDSDDLGFDIREMQVGENQSFVDKEGRAVLITRIEGGYSFNVDGKTVEMPSFDEIHQHHAPLADVDVRVMKQAHAMAKTKAPHVQMHRADGVMIVSEQEIDRATQDAVREALRAAGHDTVHFIEGGQHAVHEIKIEKAVEVDN